MCVAHDAVIEIDGKGGADGGDVLIVALGELVGAKLLACFRQRDAHGFHEFARQPVLFHVVEVEVLQQQDALTLIRAQHDFCAEHDHPRRRVADRRAVGHTAAQGAGAADRLGGKALPQFVQRVIVVQFIDGAVGVVQRDGGADFQLAVDGRDAVQFLHLARVDHVAQIAHLLGHPQANVGGAGQDGGGGFGGAQGGHFFEGARRVESLAVVRVAEHDVSLQALQGGLQGGAVEADGGQLAHADGGIDNRTVAGAAAQVSGQRLVNRLAAGRLGLAFLLQV